MKTTVDISKKLLKSVMEKSGCKTIRAAVLTALGAYEQRAKQREAIRLLGTFKDFMTQADLRRMRGMREKRHDRLRRQLDARAAAQKRANSGRVSRRKSA